MKKSDSMLRDAIYKTYTEDLVDFKFDESVASVFGDMIRRSVPGYEILVTHIGLLAGMYAQPGTILYDLGCSLGAVSMAMRAHVTQPDCCIHALDNSPEMIERCRSNTNFRGGGVPVEFIEEDVLVHNFEPSSVMVMNFILQFINPEARRSLLERLYKALNPGGILLLSEKIHLSDESCRDWMIDLHHAWKAANNYSALEISQKRSALENVMITETSEAQIERLRDIGFRKVMTWHQSYNFISIIALK